MGWFKDLFVSKPKIETKYIDMMMGTSPIFTQFGTNIYASDVVQTCIDAKATEMSKLIPRHIRAQGVDAEPVFGNIQMVLDDPNEFMTWSEFIEKCVWLRELNYNVFIFKSYENTPQGRRLRALYPLQPVQVDFLETPTGIIVLKFRFVNGYESTIPATEVIHWKKRYSVNEFMGGNAQGQPDTNALLKVLQMNHELVQSVAKALKASYAINGVVKYHTILDRGMMENNIKELEKKINEGLSGFLPMDLEGDLIPFKRDIKVVDKETLDFMDDKITRFYGTPVNIIRGEYTKEQYESWYQRTIEADINSLQQVMTKSIFTPTARAHGNKIRLYARELMFVTTEQKIEFIKEVGGRGALTNGYMLGMFGIDPALAGDTRDKRYMSLNYADVEIANQYQLDGKGQQTEGTPQSQENDTSGNEPTTSEVKDAAKEVVNKTLNGAQTQSLIEVIGQYKSGVLTYQQTINIISISIGISKEEAKELLGEVDSGKDGTNDS